MNLFNDHPHMYRYSFRLLRARAWLPDSSVTYTEGCDVGADDDSEVFGVDTIFGMCTIHACTAPYVLQAGFARAEALAAAADGAVFLFLGLDDDTDGEGQVVLLIVVVVPL